LKVAAYARASTSDRDQDPETQLVALRDFARLQQWEIVREYVDHAPANDPLHRTATRKLLDDAAKRRFQAVLVFKLDRAFRSVAHRHQTLQVWEAQGIGFVSAREGFDTRTALGRLVLNLPRQPRGVRAGGAVRAGEGRNGPGAPAGRAHRPSAGDGAAGIYRAVGGCARGPGRQAHQPVGGGPAVGLRVRDPAPIAGGSDGGGRGMRRRRGRIRGMRVAYDPEADGLHLEFRDGIAADNVDARGVTADLDCRGNLLGIEVRAASRRLRPFLRGLPRRCAAPAAHGRDAQVRRRWLIPREVGAWTPCGRRSHGTRGHRGGCRET